MIGSLTLITLVGCFAPRERLMFPTAPLRRDAGAISYDVNGDGKADFTLLLDSAGRVRSLAYDDDQDGRADRVYDLNEYAPDRVPHLILMLDSIPFGAVDARYRAGGFACFDPPQKVVAPFPSLTEPAFNEILHTPPRPGILDQHYDPQAGRIVDDLTPRIFGRLEPWERRLDYRASASEWGMAFVDPLAWMRAEMAWVKRAVDENPRSLTLAYVATTSAMLSKFGETGLRQSLDEAERLCLQLMYERRGAIRISIFADHGHNLVPTKNVDVAPALEAAGFRLRDSLCDDRDVVLELDGLTTYFGVHTRRPPEVAEALARVQQVELAFYLAGDRVIIRSVSGLAYVESRSGRVRYVPIEGDPLELSAVIERMRQARQADADGFASDSAWLEATVDHSWPDAPRRLWDAFHGESIAPPKVMCSVRDGFAVGKRAYEKYIQMASTHGGLNQATSVTFVISTTGRVTQPLRSRSLLRTLEPGLEREPHP